MFQYPSSRRILEEPAEAQEAYKVKCNCAPLVSSTLQVPRFPEPEMASLCLTDCNDFFLLWICLLPFQPCKLWAPSESCANAIDILSTHFAKKLCFCLSNLLFHVPVCPTLLLPPLIIYGFLLPPSSDISFPS